ncbi:MAG: HD domain-containing protein [Candidatus Pacearchaeota archaeon]|nr:HD domain-containing protein [Candidatus Pacearchaeota archaeon]
MEEVEKFVRSKLLPYFVEVHVKVVLKEAEYLLNFYPNADKEVVKYGCWLHDVGIKFGEKNVEGYARVDKSGEPHHLASLRLAKEFLKTTNLPEDKVRNILHCVESHRTSTPPDPETIEAKIVASADNLAHFVMAGFMIKMWEKESVVRKLKRDLEFPFMLPEALERAKKLSLEIEKEFDVKIL